MEQRPDPSPATDARELERFAAMARDWWDAAGPMAPLHRMGPVRVAYVRDQTCARLGRDPRAPRPLDGLAVLDVGCGGGLMAEPMARLGAVVTGIDPAPDLVEVARRHAADAELAGIRYEAATVEDLADRGERFDLVLALEVVEHVPDPPAFLAALAQVVRPGGLAVLSTLSRTLRSLLAAKVAAEYLLGWLPRGTHDWRAFLTPAELARHLRRAGLRPLDVTGVAYRADRGEFALRRDPGVNYLMTAARD
jgi:2-polyprenyl-6-hydroxyphenyl methylase / 3-demethylubiquinone-9 3-methyltransferase